MNSSISNLSNRFRSDQVFILTLATIFSCTILGLRLYLTGTRVFSFLAWNLFLAWIPLLITQALFRIQKRPLWVTILGLAGWLLFLPNSPYILTDLFHLRPRIEAPIWFDMILIVSFAWTGMMLGFASLRQVQVEVLDQLGSWRSQILTGGLLLLTSFGVYLGRYLRWNSWDLITRPWEIITDVLELILHPLDHLRSTGFTLCMGLFLVLAYMSYSRKESGGL